MAWNPASIARCLAAAVVATVTLFVAYVSSGKGVWIRKMHLSASETPNTSVRHVRKVGARLPTPYPDAWYCVALTEELAPGQVVPATACNHNLVVWRPKSTASDPMPAPVVMDAYCPHLGAHLGLGGGRVEENGCIRCPFHGWTFDRAGKCTHVPGSDTCPSAEIPTWPVTEQNGVISVWMSSSMHKRSPPPAAAMDASGVGANPSKGTLTLAYDAPADAAEATAGEVKTAATDSVAPPLTSPSYVHPERRARNKPWFHIPVIPGLNGPDKWDYHGYTENIVNAVLFEIPENGSDVAHLPALHAEFVIPSLTWLLTHKWDATWKGSTTGENRHIADITVDEAIALLDKTMPGEVNVHIKQCGPSQVYLQMSTPIGRVIVVETVTPIAPMKLRVLHAIYTPRNVPRFFAKVVMLMTVIQFEKDVPIWCNKKYEAKPVLSKADRAIPNYRRWITQFYNSDSVTFEEAVKQHMADELGFPVDAKLDW